MLAVIGSADLFMHSGCNILRREVSRTAYGEPSSPLTFVDIDGCEVMFIERHGRDNRIPPHAVNYRANIWSLHYHGAKVILSVGSAACISSDLQPGDLVLPDQIIDYTCGRIATFSNTEGDYWLDFSEPYDNNLRRQIVQAANESGIELKVDAVYAVTQGPRLETIAEVNRLERDGAHIVGMTGMPEAVLVRELGIPFATVNDIVNHAAGRGKKKNAVPPNMEAALQQRMAGLREIIARLAKQYKSGNG